MKRYYVYEQQPGATGKQLSSHTSAFRAKHVAGLASKRTANEVYAELHVRRGGRLEVISIARYQRGEQVG